jgi:hypothetical protein
VKTNRRKTLQDITGTLNEGTPVKISHSTVRRRLSFFGYKRRIVKKKIIVSNVNCFKRRAWYRSKLHCTVENFWKVIFSDDTQIVLPPWVADLVLHQDSMEPTVHILFAIHAPYYLYFPNTI